MHDRRKALLPVALVLALFFGGTALGQERSLPLWKVERPDGGVLWLLGSIHMRAEEKRTVDRTIAEAVDRADLVAVESDTEGKEVLLTGFFNRNGILPEGRTLFDLLPPERHASLEAALDSISTARDISRYKPWAISLLITVKSLEACGYHAGLGIDRMVLARVRGQKKIVELEDLRDPLRAMNELSPEADIAALESALSARDKGCGEEGKLFAAWEAGDLEAIERYMAEQVKENPELASLNEAILYERSRRFAERIEAGFGDARFPLVVIGVGHMVGKDNVPELLAARGFHVTRLPAAGEQVDFAPAPKDAGAAKRFEKLGFSVLLPCTPVEKLQEMGPDMLPLHVFTCEWQGRWEYSVLVLPFSPKHSRKFSPEELADRSAREFPRSMSAFKATGPVRPLAISGYPARRLEGTISENPSSILFVATEPALYQLSLIRKGWDPPLSAGDFFASFRLTGDAPATR